MNKISKIKENTQQGGFALILALIISSVVLAIGLSMLDITVKQLNLSTTSRQSEIAFQTAAAGMNCLQRARNKYPFDTQIGTPVTFNCLGNSITITDSNPSPKVQQFRVNPNGFNWNPSGSANRCVDIEMYVYDATGAAITPMVNGKTCSLGSVCTVAFSRGYNRACNGSDDVFTVQRELTAEF